MLVISRHFALKYLLVNPGAQCCYCLRVVWLTIKSVGTCNQVGQASELGGPSTLIFLLFPTFQSLIPLDYCARRHLAFLSCFPMPKVLQLFSFHCLAANFTLGKVGGGYF